MESLSFEEGNIIEDKIDFFSLKKRSKLHCD